MEPNYPEGVSERRFKREDGSLGPPQRGPWRRWSVLSKADRPAAILNAAATVLCAAPLYWGSPKEGNPLGFALVAPLVGAAFFVALVVQFLERENRHGLVRGLLAVGAATLAFGGLVFAGEVAAARVALFYWVPAILSILAAIVLQKAHLAVEAKDAVRSDGGARSRWWIRRR